MPLLPSVLADGLKAIDTPQPPPDLATTAQRWADAWGSYVAGCVQITPGTAPVMQSAFKGVLGSAFVNAPVPLAFFQALEAAMAAGWAVAIPLPPLVSFTPAPPATFASSGATIVPVGLASKDKAPVREMLAGLIDTWTRTIIAVGPSGPVGPVS